MSHLKKLLFAFVFVVVVVLTFSTVASSPMPQAEPTVAPVIGSACQATRVIGEGDTCYFIATEICKVTLDVLYNNNGSLEGGQKCDALKIGDVLCCKY
jgi:hypothetical protein